MNELERVELISYFAGWDEVAYWNHYQEVQDYYLKMFYPKHKDKTKKLGVFQNYFSRQFIKRDIEILEKFFIFDKSINEMVFNYEGNRFIIQNSSMFEVLYKTSHLEFISHRINFQFEVIALTEQEEKNLLTNLKKILWQLKKKFKE